MSQRIYPIGVQNFEKIRKDGYLYVDKTALIHQLVTTGSYYFLSRPRRFGKSLLISTLKAYFQGKKELFKGLAMEQLEEKWTVYPVLRLDLNIEKYDTVESLENILNNHLSRWEKIYGSDESEASFPLRFAGIIRRACEQTGQRVVVLVDEYDKPLLQSIGHKEVQTELRNTLKPFYGVLKTMDECIRFALLTGVTKFGKVSVFSDLNNLNDISLDAQYTSLCGITEKELHTCFKEEIQELATLQQTTYECIAEELRKIYGGFLFSTNAKEVYDLSSLLKALSGKYIRKYWFEDCTPTYLMDLLRNNDFDLDMVDEVQVSDDFVNGINVSDDNIISGLFQSGYLVIKHYDTNSSLYSLGFPNQGVEDSYSYIKRYIKRYRERSIPSNG